MKTSLILSLPLIVAPSLHAQDADLAKQLANPVSSLISLPFQGNLDFGIGPGAGQKFTTNIQPVIPFALNDDWNLISRTILPVVDVEGTQLGGLGDEFGLGDVVQSFFVSPQSSDPIWGLGPVLLLPTATDSVLGGEKWGAGPTGVMLKQQGSWTYGTLVNHLWDFAGDDSRSSVNATFIQPFVSYITDSKTTYTINVESTYDWTSHQWSVPVNFVVNQLFTAGGQPFQLFGGVRYYVEKPTQGPDWGLRFGVTFLFPK
ncbi:hypothetical protein HNR46_002514 [Haloferula luteola]|uniref:Transporter n=1 Tax=Haloferula luteola TaxID=595692 RepID=A0A840VHQ1_9BACT|nr:transporter [Haloferula luteola]MBB5352271.1 hypothetical protein [Haloferula luteola]